MDILTAPVAVEETIKNSRFLSELFPLESQAEARNFIKEQKQKYPDAKHVVHAFIVGSGGEIMGMSDDGEPSGTAGRPVLDVLKGRGCTNVILTITRWFGGTLLGTGGLVKAYGGGAKKVIEAADLQKAFSELVSKTPFSFVVDYALYKPVKIIMENFSLYEITEDFGTEIKLCGKIKSDEFSLFSEKLKELSNGKILL